MFFWIVAALITAAVAAVLLRALLQGGASESTASFDMKVYRDQLAEVDNDLARGIVSESEAKRLNIEISRRILAADQAGRRAAGPAGTARPLWGIIAVSVPLAAALALYERIGAPGYPDMPMSARLERAAAFHDARKSQAEAAAETPRPAAPAADADYLALVERLRKAVAANPEDIQGLTLLARNEAILGNMTASAEALARIATLKGPAASAADYAALADTYVLAAGGYVSPEAEAALNRAVEIDPQNGTARFYLGLMWSQTGRPDLAFAYWAELLREGPEDAPWIAPIRARIAMLAAAAGIDYTPPAAPDGPSAEDLASAGDMSAEDRAAMITGMVDRLAERLASEGGTPEEWARLITALGVLGETDRARTTWREARSVFAGQDAALAAIRRAAQQAGLSE